jgi:uncharacterized membrane protein
MNSKMYNMFTFISMAGVIAAGFIINGVFPSLPGYFYLAMAIVCGTVILLASKSIARRSDTVISDERTERNYKKAANITYRVTYTLTLSVACGLIAFSGNHSELVIVGKVLIAVSIFQTMFFTCAYLIVDMKSK